MITIIVPIYNSANYLDRCIESLIKQTYEDLEIILVDDGSTDNSLDICEQWKEKDKRIKIFHEPSNKGVSIARNTGIKNAGGDYIILIDSDDWLAINSCERLLSEMKKKKADCVICGLKQTSGNIWAPVFNRFYDNHKSFQHDFVYWLNTELLSSSVNKIYSREKIKTLYPENMSYGEDLTFVLNYLKHCERISFITDPLYQHEVYNNVSLTHSFAPERFHNLEQIQQSILSFGEKKEQTNPHIYDKYIRDTIRSIRMWYKRKDISRKNKGSVIKKWKKYAYITKLNVSDYNLSIKDKLILYSLKTNFHMGIEIIVNGKEYVNRIFKRN